MGSVRGTKSPEMAYLENGEFKRGIAPLLKNPSPFPLRGRG